MWLARSLSGPSRRFGLGLEQVAELRFKLGQRGVELADMLAQMFGAEGIGGFEPVGAWLFLAQEEAVGAARSWSWRLPSATGFHTRGVLAGAEVGDEGGVKGVVLGADETAVGVVAGAAGRWNVWPARCSGL